MTPDQLNTLSQRIYSTLIRERRMREAVFPPGHVKRDAKLEDIDGAIEALKAIKLELALHTEEPPEQVALIDDVPTVQRGGY
jgi:hypothetical protein